MKYRVIPFDWPKNLALPIPLQHLGKLIRKYSSSLELFSILAIGVLHLSTWWAPLVGSDEVAFANFALYHDIHLFGDVLPPNLAILRSWYGFGLIPVYMTALSAVLRTCGVGIASLRMIPMVSGLIALVLLYALMKKTKAGYGPISGLVFFALSTPYFLTTHTARAESIILVITVLNVGWWLLDGSRFIGALIGVMTGLGFGIYPSAVYGVSTLLALALWDRRKDIVKTDHVVLWSIGVMIGLCAVARWIDIDQACRYFSVQSLLYRSLWIRDSAITFHSLNILRFLNQGLLTMVQGSGPGSPYYPYWIAWLLATLLIQIRRPWSTLRTERLVVLVAAATWVTHSLLTISAQTHMYALLFFPWWIWQSGVAVQRIIQNKMSLDGIDGATLGLSIAIFIFPANHAIVDTLLACLILLTFFPRATPLSGRRRAMAGPIFVLYGILSCVVILGTDHFRIPARLHHGAAQQKMIQSEATQLRTEKKIIGPMSLWLYDPTLNLRSLDFVFMGLQQDPTPWIIAYRPTLVLWPRSGVAELNALLVARHSTLSFFPVSSWVLPATYARDFVGLELRENRVK